MYVCYVKTSINLKKKKEIREVSVEIDKLTNSIEEALTGKLFQTEFFHLMVNDTRQIKKKAWLFNWKSEIGYTDRQVFKMTVEGEEDIIQGLLSFSIETDHVFIHIIESAMFNRGANRKYRGVAGNMFAFACKCSIDAGLGGFVSFKAKTVLIEHYRETIGATQFKGQRMFIDKVAATALIKQYFNS
jgi:hypothetical protein